MNIPLNIDWQQILLHVFNFMILALGLYLLLYKPVKKFMDSREEYYRGRDEKSESKLREAEALRAEYSARLEGADEEIARSRAEAARASEAEAKAKIEEANRRSEKIIIDAENTAIAEKKKIMKGAEEEIVGMIATAAEKLMLGENVRDCEIYNRFLDSVKEGGNAEGRKK